MFITPIALVDQDQIVVTASRTPVAAEESAASVAIIDEERIVRLGPPLISTLLRLTTSVAVSTSGPLGSLTDVRIRGSEANHTLLFIDGIRANDPAAGDAPRFELLNADLASRVEVVRGPQSALWGSDAIGGVIAVKGRDRRDGSTAALEAGSFGFARASASHGLTAGKAALAAAIGWQRSDGIDSFGAPGGDRDGYRNFSGRVRGTLAPRANLTLGASGLLLTGRSQFDGYDPLTFERTDTLDNTRNRLAAGRLWADIGSAEAPWSGLLGASLLHSSNRNFLASDATNRTSGRRAVIDGQLQRRFSAGAVDNRLILALEGARETFRARGVNSGLVTDQDRDRTQYAATVEWRVSLGPIVADLAARRDIFNRFKDATSVRGSLLADVGHGVAVAAAYAQGIAQPTFFDLYGTFPNIFVGNPDLRPETSRGGELSIRYRRRNVQTALTAFRQRLHDEIVDIFDLTTFRASTKNSSGVSRRWGLEAELGWQITPQLRLTAHHAYLDATQPDSSTGVQLRERRRPRHSGAVALDGSTGRWSYGASLVYAGAHLDSQEVFPFGIVRVEPHWLVDARAAYSIRPNVEVFARASNLFDHDYEQVAGYRTEGSGLFLGFRLADRRSSP